MRSTNRTYAPLEAFVDELARCGLEHAVASPGSRNAPILLALAAEPRIRTWSVLDERSTAFMALGLAKASGRPVALTCTSGTAAANFLPAVIEAREARVPLIVLTADRPPELREVGAGQSIDQLKLYGSAVKWFVEVGNLEPGRESAVHHRALACRAWASAQGGRPGPVHLNFPLREPLAPVPEVLEPEVWRGRPAGEPWTSVAEAPPALPKEELAVVADELLAVGSGAIVCGGVGGTPLGKAVATAAARLAGTLGWPLLAEPTSGVRCGRHDRSHVIAHYDALLRADRWAAAHRPDLVVRVGDTPTSKPLRGWLAEARQVVIDPHAAWHEPTRLAHRLLVAEPAGALDALARATARGTRHPPTDGRAPSGGGAAAAFGTGAAREPATGEDGTWLASWRTADALVPEALAGMPEPFEPKAYTAIFDVVPADATVWVSSSMPIRDLETFLPALAKPVRLLSNRGANGIDGVVSSALGAAAAGPGRAYLLTGELALVHDVGALLAAGRLGLELTIVCVDNGGGGIFDFLPVARHADPPAYERLVATPSGVDVERLAHGLGLRHTRAETAAEVAAAAAQPGLIEVRTDRTRNAALHRELFARLAEDLDRLALGQKR